MMVKGEPFSLSPTPWATSDGDPQPQQGLSLAALDTSSSTRPKGPPEGLTTTANDTDEVSRAGH